jgi:DNA-binding transcriptional LysR family regulator
LNARNPTIKVPSFMTAPPMIVDTQRLCIVPARLVGLVTMAWPLRVVRLPPSYRALKLRMVWHVRHDLDPVHRWLRGMLLETGAMITRGEKGYLLPSELAFAKSG